ncbi:phospholipase D-like domain-containing protein [Rhodococcus sp. NPDC058521]|uniref:phospholipase D-like domain-containing protein n=1 Tax=Rhodococcus sp. NPDC058521 TaxID=3346536 RepID=UPI0036680823
MREVPSILEPGITCWRIEEADRLSVVIDADDYFRHAKAAMLRARRRIMLIGWDFDTRISLEPHGKTLDGPDRLGKFLEWLTKTRPELEIYLLKWNIGAFTALGRGMTPVFVSNWITSDRLHLQLDGAHPVGAAHHQKIVVIDDALAFCGGIDMTVDRWDTSDHTDGSAHRVEPGGEKYGPWHDVTTAVDGDAAAAVGELARHRWRVATGTDLAPVPDSVGSDPWPENLAPTVTGVNVGIARTAPDYEDREGVFEIESLYLAAIASAERSLYIESQYLASRKLAEALAKRLREPDSPEVVLVIPRNADGWLEQMAMDGARRKLLHLLWNADGHNRLGIYYPVTSDGEPIYVHAKVMVVDDRLLRVGSSNLNNRSMGFDTECDLAVEVESHTPNAEQVTEAILGVRRRLVSEHLDVDEDEFEATLAETNSLLSTVERLRSTGKTLERFEPDTVADEDSPLAENELMDPERTPPTLLERLRRNPFRSR